MIIQRKNTKKQWFLACIGLVSLAYYILHWDNILVEKPGRLLVVTRGTSLIQLTERLKEEGYLKHTTTFLWTAYLLRYRPQQSPGQYRFTGPASNWQAIKKLRGAMQHPVKVSFSVAADKEALVEQLVRFIGLEKEMLLTLLNDSNKLAPYGFTTENVLTMFIPATYEVYWTVTTEQLLAKIYTNYRYFWNPIRLDQAKAMQLTSIEVAILASIVQSETNDPKEAMRIAGVYVNRLKRKMRLESCPVLIYALKKKALKVKRVLHKDIAVESPYNSYRKTGLPPGPIVLPSVEMIDAVLNYEKNDYLFFSAKEDFSGTHYFERTYDAHLKNSAKYKKALNALKIMR